MSRTFRCLPTLVTLLLLPALVAAASGIGSSRTMDYAWLLFLKVNEPPQVDAGKNQGISGDTAHLSASVIDDPKDTLTYAWVKVSGSGSVWFDNASAKQTLVTFSASGTYTLKFTADDGEFESSDTVVIAVTNTSPNVSAGANKQITHPTNSVSLSGSVSDGENNVEGVVWSKVSGPGGVTFSNPSSPISTVTFASGAVGTYVLRLSASDWEYTRSDTVTVNYLSQPAPKIDVIVAVGDSITVGLGDNDCTPGDTTAKSCSGYTPVLEGLLEQARGYNIAVRERGTSGATSSYGRSVIQSIVNANSDADQYLVMYGTNDANPWAIPVITPAIFKNNLQQIINTIKSAGAQPVLAKAPYAKEPRTYKNPYILQFNAVVEQLRIQYSIEINAPDFYAWFQGHTYQLNSDGLHPTHSGYSSMANLWRDKLTQ